MSFKNFYDSNEYNLGRSHRAWRGRTHIRPCDHDSSKSFRATYESRRGVPLGDARSVPVCGYVGGSRLAPYLVVSPYRCGLVRFCFLGLYGSQAPLARMAASAPRRARELVYCYGNRALGRQLGDPYWNPRGYVAVGVGTPDGSWITDNRVGYA